MAKRLLWVTDHVFFSHGEAHYDNYGFNYEFFEPYLEVFEEVHIIARVQPVESIDKLVKSSGDRLTFHPISNVHGLKWFLNSKSLFSDMKRVVESADCICYRLPATAGFHIHNINKSLSKPKPWMTEFVGDPLDSLFTEGENPIVRSLKVIVGKIHGNRQRKILAGAVCSSYVSQSHLQKIYPHSPKATVYPISSIRLPSEYLLDGEKEFPKSGEVFRIVEVASFVRPKNQVYLIQIVKRLIDYGLLIELHFIGSGDEMEKAQREVQNLGIQEAVTFHGQVTGFHNVVDILDRCHMFSLPSFSEGVPRSMIEAMARGLLCTGTPIGGIVELIPLEMTYSLGNVDDAAKVLKDVIESPENWSTWSKRNVAKAREYTTEVLGPRRIELLTKLKESSDNE